MKPKTDTESKTERKENLDLGIRERGHIERRKGDTEREKERYRPKGRDTKTEGEKQESGRRDRQADKCVKSEQEKGQA